MGRPLTNRKPAKLQTRKPTKLRPRKPTKKPTRKRQNLLDVFEFTLCARVFSLTILYLYTHCLIILNKSIYIIIIRAVKFILLHLQKLLSLLIIICFYSSLSVCVALPAVFFSILPCWDPRVSRRSSPHYVQRIYWNAAVLSNRIPDPTLLYKPVDKLGPGVGCLNYCQYLLHPVDSPY